jgi:hypothetical protein
MTMGLPRAIIRDILAASPPWMIEERSRAGQGNRIVARLREMDE